MEERRDVTTMYIVADLIKIEKSQDKNRAKEKEIFVILSTKKII